MSHDESASMLPAVSVEVDDVDARARCFSAATRTGTSSTC